MRVYELAKELGLEPAVVMSRLDYLGESVRSVSSTLSPRVEDRVKESFTNLGSGTPSTRDRFRPPRPVSRAPRQRRERWRGEIKPMARVMLNHMPLDPGGPWEHEVTTATLQAGLWGQEFFDHQEAAAWLDQCPGIDARTAAQFRDAGIPPNLAAQRPWYGKINPERPSLYERVAMHDLPIGEAVEELRHAGLV